jgi:hypothetical protein
MSPRTLQTALVHIFECQDDCEQTMERLWKTTVVAYYNVHYNVSLRAAEWNNENLRQDIRY